MATSSARKEWQQFKKDHPEFTQDRRIKADLGPQLDKLTKTAMMMAKAEEVLDKALKDALAQYKSVVISLQAYKLVADATSDPKVKADFKDLYREYRENCEGLDMLLGEWNDYRKASAATDL